MVDILAWALQPQKLLNVFGGKPWQSLLDSSVRFYFRTTSQTNLNQQQELHETLATGVFWGGESEYLGYLVQKSPQHPLQERPGYPEADVKNCANKPKYTCAVQQ